MSGMSRPFAPLGTSHLVVLALTFLVPVALATFSRGRAEIARAIRLVFASLLIATWTLWYWLVVSSGWTSFETILPMQLCDWAGFAAITALIVPRQRSFELAYFWAFSGTLQALMTPELYYNFPDLRFIVFFAFHGGVIASVLYLMLALRMRPYASSLPRVALWSLAYFVAAVAVNFFLHTNFGYLREKPTTHSLLDLMAPWPWYIFELLALGVIYILVLYAPFFLSDILRAPQKKVSRGDAKTQRQ